MSHCPRDIYEQPSNMSLDKNDNAARLGQKMAWKRFHKKLSLLPDDHDALVTWQSLKDKRARSLQSKFIECWAKEEKWNFVSTFKSEFMQETKHELTEFDWLTKKQMEDKYGDRAFAVMRKKKKAGEHKIDEDDGEPRWRVKVKEVSGRGTMHTKQRGADLKVNDDKHHKDPKKTELLAMADGPADRNGQKQTERQASGDTKRAKLAITDGNMHTDNDAGAEAPTAAASSAASSAESSAAEETSAAKANRIKQVLTGDKGFRKQLLKTFGKAFVETMESFQKPKLELLGKLVDTLRESEGDESHP